LHFLVAHSCLLLPAFAYFCGIFQQDLANALFNAYLHWSA
jgi:hypothetical protein